PKVFQVASSMDFNQYALKDYYGVYHAWNMGSQGPITALAQYYLIQNPNVMFTYNPQGNGSMNGQDDHYYWVTSTATLTSTHAAQTACTTAAPCTLTISG